MIEEMKQACDDWLGDNGDDTNEYNFCLGFMLKPVEQPTLDYDAGFRAGNKYWGKK